MKIFVCSNQNNDLVKVMLNNGIEFKLCETPQQAWELSCDGDLLMLLADNYPDKVNTMPENWRQAMADNSRRIYAEFCGAEDELPSVIKYERVVVNCQDFGEDLASMRIVAIHDCHFLRRNRPDALLTAAKVAGFDTAIFGLPEEHFPLLYRLGESGLVATCALSHFVVGRFAPTESWQIIWGKILSLLTNSPVKNLQWQPEVAPSFASDVNVTPQDIRNAAQRGAAWFEKARLFRHQDWEGQYKLGSNNYPDGLFLSPYKRGLSCGDGSLGMIEGANSKVNFDGSNQFNYTFRADCMGEATFALSLAGKEFNCDRWLKQAENLSRYIYVDSYFAQGTRANPNSASYGLVAWMGNDVKNGVYYGDDNARLLLGSIGAAATIPDYAHLPNLARCLVSNMRTTGLNGFRGSRLEDDDMQLVGWKHYFEQEITNYAPHFESWLWACYFWSYAHGGNRRFLECAENGCVNMMKNYPENWHWTNGMQQERARMLLPLAWRARVVNSEEAKRDLEFMVEELLRYQDEVSGGIREEVGAEGKGEFGPCPSNEAYGSTEAPLIQSNDDKLVDLLYTTNFAFIGLHEAVAVTQNERWKRAEDKLAAFLTKIQVKSTTQPDVDGGWFRAFDINRHDYWGSNADAGWGVWSIETGWTQSWIVGTLCLREQQTSLWDLTQNLEITDELKKAESTML